MKNKKNHIDLQLFKFIYADGCALIVKIFKWYEKHCTEEQNEMAFWNSMNILEQLHWKKQ